MASNGSSSSSQEKLSLHNSEITISLAELEIDAVLHRFVITLLLDRSRIYWDSRACLYFKNFIASPECCDERLTTACLDQVENYILSKDADTIRDELQKINKHKRDGVLVLHEIAKEDKTFDCFTCGNVKRKDRACIICYRVVWAVFEMVHRPDMWRSISPNVYLSCPFICTEQTPHTQELTAMINLNTETLYVTNNYREHFIDFILSSSFRDGLDRVDRNSINQAATAVATMLHCPRRERVPDLKLMCQSMLCIYLHELKQGESSCETVDELIPILPASVVNELQIHYILLEKHTDLLKYNVEKMCKARLEVMRRRCRCGIEH